MFYRAALVCRQHRFEITITKTHTTLQTLQHMNILNLTLFPLSFMDGVHWRIFCMLSASQEKRNNISSHLIHRGNSSFSRLPEFFWNRSPFLPQKLSVTQLNALLVFHFSVKFKITLGELLGGGHSWGTVGGQRVHSSSSVCAGRGHIQWMTSFGACYTQSCPSPRNSTFPKFKGFFSYTFTVYKLNKTTFTLYVLCLSGLDYVSLTFRAVGRGGGGKGY